MDGERSMREEGYYIGEIFGIMSHMEPGYATLKMVLFQRQELLLADIIMKGIWWMERLAEKENYMIFFR